MSKYPEHEKLEALGGERGGRVNAPYEAEARAWNWLLELERLPWREYGHNRLDQQVIVRACPGKLGATSGAPLIRVTVDIGSKRRVRGSGNSLSAAVLNLYGELKRVEVEVPPPVGLLIS